LSGAAHGTLTYWLVPLKVTAMSASPARAPGWARVGVPV
jgi:hypothetical protein